MIYAQFFELPAVEGCGDRSVIILDGRNNQETYHKLATDWALKHGYWGYQLRRAMRLSSAYQNNISKEIAVPMNNVGHRVWRAKFKYPDCRPGQALSNCMDLPKELVDQIYELKDSKEVVRIVEKYYGLVS